jgi:hypothetical protein
MRSEKEVVIILLLLVVGCSGAFQLLFLSLIFPFVLPSVLTLHMLLYDVPCTCVVP